MATFRPVPLVPGIGQFTADSAAAAAIPKPRPAIAEPVPAPAVGSTGEGLTLDALMARQKEAAAMQAGNMQQEVTNIPQGLSQLAWTVVNALKERQAGRELEQGQQEVSNAFGQMNWDTGQLPPEAMQTLFTRNPELGMQMYQTAMALKASAGKQEQWTPIPTPAGESGQWYQNQNGDTRKVGGGEGAGGLKPTDVAAMYDDFANVPDVKNLQNGQSMWVSMQEAATRDTAQADLNMVIAMAKLFDPTSVVRTEEGKAVELTGDAPSSVKGYFQYLTGTPGSRLSKATRQGMMQEAFSRMNGYYKGVKQASDYFTAKATRHGVNPADVVRPFEAPAEFDLEKVVGSDTETTPPPDAETPPEEDTTPGTLPYPAMPSNWPPDKGFPDKGTWKRMSPADQQTFIDAVNKLKAGP